MYLPRLRATAIRAVFFEIKRFSKDHRLLRMLIALDGKTIIEVPIFFQELNERSPSPCSLPTFHERIHVTNHDDTTSGPRDQDVKPFRGAHEADIPI